jgi:hypothetical protein
MKEQDSFPKEGTDFILCSFTLTSCGFHLASSIVEAVHRVIEMEYKCDLCIHKTPKSKMSSILHAAPIYLCGAVLSHIHSLTITFI